MYKKASEAMLDVLLSWGVKRVYGLPGDSIDTTIDALNTYKDKIDFIQIRHEEVGGMAAAYEAQLTGKIAVCLSIGGPGAIHMLNGLYDAKMNRVPVLALIGQVNSKFINTNYFQEVDTTELCKDVAVYNKLVLSAESLPKLVDEAVRIAIKEKGVAVLTIPDNLGAVTIKVPPANVVKEENVFNEPDIPDWKIEAAADLIKKAKRPIVLSGKGAKGAKEELKQFIEINNLPIIQTMPSKGNVADSHPNALGNLGKLGTKPAYEAMKSADLLIMLGTDYPFKDYLPDDHDKCPCIQVDINPIRFGNRYPVDVAIEGNVKTFLSKINDLGVLHDCNKYCNSCRETMEHWNKWMNEEKNNRSGNLVHPAYLMSFINKIATDDAVFSIDVGTATSWSARFLDVKPTQEILISAWLATMGCALPGAIAAKLVNPNRQAISLAGDGAMAMVMQDFVTATKYQLPIIQFVINNQKLAFIQYEQQSAGQRNYEIDLHDIDFAKVAEACGADGYNVNTADELDALLPKLQNPSKPILINVYVADDAPLPGKIVMDEAKGYAKFVIQTIVKDHKVPELPPLSTAIKRFF